MADVLKSYAYPLGVFMLGQLTVSGLQMLVSIPGELFQIADLPLVNLSLAYLLVFLLVAPAHLRVPGCLVAAAVSLVVRVLWLHQDVYSSLAVTLLVQLLALSGLAICAIIRFSVKRRPSLSQLVIYLSFAGILCPLMVSIVYGYWLSHWVTMEVAASELVWFFSIATFLSLAPAMVIFAPLMVYGWCGAKHIVAHWRSVLTPQIWGTGLAAMLLMAVLYWVPHAYVYSAQIYVVTILLVLAAAVRFGVVAALSLSSVIMITGALVTLNHILGSVNFDLDVSSLNPVDLKPLQNVQCSLLLLSAGALLMAHFVEELSLTKTKLARQNSKYRTIYENVPISIWEEDFSEVRRYLDGLGIDDADQLSALFEDDPAVIDNCVRLVKVISVNPATMTMFGVQSDVQRLGDLASVIDRREKTIFAEELIAFFRGESIYHCDALQKRINGEAFMTSTSVNLVPGCEATWRRVIVAIEDIGARIKAEKMVKQFFDMPLHLHIVTSLDGLILRVNHGWQDILGYKSERVAGTSFFSLIHPDQQVEVIERISQAFHGDGRIYFESRYRKEDGTYRLLEWSLLVSMEDQCIFASANDITAKKLYEERLRETAKIFQSTSEGVVITDLTGVIKDINSAFTAITGYDRGDIIGQHVRVLKSGRHGEDFYKIMWKQLNKTGHWRGEIWNRKKNGAIYPELSTISAVSDDAGVVTGYVAIFSDISDIKDTEKRLTYLSHHDPLTCLPNRVLLLERLSQSIKHAARQKTTIAVVFIDLDQFKHINDSLGHAEGDKLLQAVATRLVGVVRHDDTVARIGGDEFVVVLESIKSADHAAFVTEKMMRAFREPIDLTGSSVSVTASFGISLYPSDGRDAQLLMRNADAAMHRAKDNGRNSYHFYTEELTASALEYLFLENALRSALEENQFYLVYQPQVELQSATFVGVEALLRWTHSSGSISPADFIPVAEQSGLIREIGYWVLCAACEQGAQWLKKGVEYNRVWVNVAGPQFQYENFVATVAAVLRKTGLQPRSLGIEVTESFVMNRADDSVEQLHELRAMGIEIAIDDFGTGYSSLSYLKRLPIDKLKIDRAFVQDICEDKNDRAIAEAIIALGKALNMTVIAEGIETPGQAQLLSEQGCEQAQGYWFSRPVTAEKLEADFLNREPQSAVLPK